MKVQRILAVCLGVFLTFFSLSSSAQDNKSEPVSSLTCKFNIAPFPTSEDGVVIAIQGYPKCGEALKKVAMTENFQKNGCAYNYYKHRTQYLVWCQGMGALGTIVQAAIDVDAKNGK